LPLTGGHLEDIAEYSEPYDDPDDPYTALWTRFTAKPRPAFEFDPIAWGSLPGKDADDNPTCDAAELAEAGDYEGATEILMNVLCEDLRCIDAHAHLGNWALEHSPKRAILHYEIGVGIGELSLPAGFDGLLCWGSIYNRPFLRCLHGYGLCLWRLGKFAEAQGVFERILSLNPNDNQGVRACWDDVRNSRTWEAMRRREEDAAGRRPGHH
jgi:tetratricopeptide (TPR) repeat protein